MNLYKDILRLANFDVWKSLSLNYDYFFYEPDIYLFVNITDLIVINENKMFFSRETKSGCINWKSGKFRKILIVRYLIKFLST